MSRLVIEAGQSGKAYWSDLWRYRELFFFLAWRDVLVRYKQTVIGILWAVLRPLLTMLVFTLVFGKLAKMPSEGLPYPVWVFAALLPWQFFSSALAEASNSLVTNSNLLSKIYFPRLVVPASSVIVSLIDFLIAAALMVIVLAWYRVAPNWRMATVPIWILLAFGAALGTSLWLAALNVKYRDFRYVIPFIVQFGLYISPVGFSSALVREKLGETAYLAYCLNPMAGVINGFRWAINGQAASALELRSVGIALVVTVILVASGLRYFRRTEETFADII